WSTFSMTSPIGVPVVTPSNVPERILTVSGSWRWVVKRDVPGRRRSSQYWMSASPSGMPGGTPSTTQPIAGPWLSPQVVKRKSWPKLLPGMGLRTFGAAAPGAASDDRDVGRVHRFHADHVIAGIDVMNLAGDAARQVAQEIEAGAADVVDRDVALERRIVLVPFQNVAEIADPGGGERLDRPGRYGVDADLLAAEVDGEIAHRRLERRLGHAHDVVVRHDPLGAVIGEGEEAAAVRHHRRRAPRYIGE